MLTTPHYFQLVFSNGFVGLIFFDFFKVFLATLFSHA